MQLSISSSPLNKSEPADDKDIVRKERIYDPCDLISVIRFNPNYFKEVETQSLSNLNMPKLVANEAINRSFSTSKTNELSVEEKEVVSLTIE